MIQLDADNLLEPTAIEKRVWFLETWPAYAFAKGFTAGFGADRCVQQAGKSRWLRH